MRRQTQTDGGLLPCIFSSIRCRAHLNVCVCCIMDAPPAVDPDPTTQPSTPVSALSSLLKTDPTRLSFWLWGMILTLPFFFLLLLPYPVLIISTRSWGWCVDLSSSQFALLVAHSVFFEDLLDFLFFFFWSPEKVFFFFALCVVQQHFCLRSCEF